MKKEKSQLIPEIQKAIRQYYEESYMPTNLRTLEEMDNFLEIYSQKHKLDLNTEGYKCQTGKFFLFRMCTHTGDDKCNIYREINLKTVCTTCLRKSTRKQYEKKI